MRVTRIMKIDFEGIVRNKKRFNGKPISHWQGMADELVVELIVRAALQQTGEYSIIGYLARKRLLEIARNENWSLYNKVLKSRVACLHGFAQIMNSILPRRKT